uniref:Uncharacterized protein n=1 Tax=Rhizophora mucronata TaxID=61149 RepID=A0A2P2PH21_RHIMU
MDYGEGKVIII